MHELSADNSMAIENDCIHDGQLQDCEMDGNVLQDDEVDGSDIDMEFEATSSGDDTDLDDKTYVARLCARGDI